MSDFHDLIATENLFNKKNVFYKNCPKRLEIIISNSLRRNQNGQTAQNRKAVKNFKKRKSTENRFEVILISNKVKFCKRNSFFTKLVLKRFKSFKTCSKWTNTAKLNKN